MSTEAKVGAFVLAGLVLMGWAIFLLGDFSIKRHYSIYADFTDVGGLPDKALVKLSGVEVGKVKKVTLGEGKVRVELAIDEGVDVYKDSEFRIGSTSLIGSKFLEIDQGHASTGVLQREAVVQGIDSPSLERAMTKALDSLQDLMGGVNGGGKLGQNLNATVENLRQTSITMNELLSETKPALSQAMKRMDDISAKLDELLGKSNSVMAKVDSSSGTLGALLSDQQMKDDMKKTFKDVKEMAGSAKDILGKIGGFRVYWNVASRYEPAAKASRGDLGIYIYPRDTRYYYLGVSNIADTADRARGLDYERKNMLEAMLGWQYPSFNFHMGLIKGYGGAGFEIKPLPGFGFMDKVWLFADAFDFQRNHNVNGHFFTQPEYDAGIRYQIHRLFSVGARVQDIAETSRFQTDARLVFEDKDLAYLFGLISFGAAGTRGRSN